MVRAHRLSVPAALLLAAVQVAPLVAQGAPNKEPKRPTLPADRDSNNAADYYFYGMSVLIKQPEKASAAFYWSSRLDPTSTPALYGQYVAQLLSQPQTTLTTYLMGGRNARKDPMLRRIDSLGYLALTKSPFLDRRIFGTVLATWMDRQTGGASDVRDLGMYDRRWTAWSAYARANFRMAASVYAEQIQRHPEDTELRFMLAMSYLSLGRPDSARFAVQEALTLERSADQDTPWIGWSSHAYAEFGVGLLYEMVSQPDSARAAFERALLDDVSFPPAHHHLARMRLAAQDTAGALDEYRQAVTLSPSDAGYLCDLGMLLLTTGRTDSAAAVLRQAATLEPYYAFPHYPLGVVYEHSGFRQEAVEHYTTFLRLAPKSMAPAIIAARQRLAALNAPAP
jgi:Flp pilus assembly protein TadD